MKRPSRPFHDESNSGAPCGSVCQAAFTSGNRDASYAGGACGSAGTVCSAWSRAVSAAW